MVFEGFGVRRVGVGSAFTLGQTTQQNKNHSLKHHLNVASFLLDFQPQVPRLQRYLVQQGQDEIYA
eukprot:6487718-Amphidinium_carterae.1